MSQPALLERGQQLQQVRLGARDARDLLDVQDDQCAKAYVPPLAELLLDPDTEVPSALVVARDLLLVACRSQAGLRVASEGSWLGEAPAADGGASVARRSRGRRARSAGAPGRATAASSDLPSTVNARCVGRKPAER